MKRKDGKKYNQNKSHTVEKLKYNNAEKFGYRIMGLRVGEKTTRVIIIRIWKVGDSFIELNLSLSIFRVEEGPEETIPREEPRHSLDESLSIENCVSSYTIRCIGGLDFVVKEKEATVET